MSTISSLAVVSLSWIDLWSEFTSRPVLWPLLLFVIITFLVVRYIPNDSVGVIEKLWSSRGSVLDGQIIALNGEAGFQAELLRGGLHVSYPRWQYRIHRHKLVTIRQGRLGYVYARDGEALPASQTLARVVDCNEFQDARRFLAGAPAQGLPRGQRGRQRAIPREGVYAINPALFVVITEEHVHALSEGFLQSEVAQLKQWAELLKVVDGFTPVVVGGQLETADPLHPDLDQLVDSIAIVTIHDGPSLDPGEIIAPLVGTTPGDPHDHNNFQDPEAFLLAGGRRGRQYQALTDGTYFLNHWFATAQMIPKTVVPIGYVGVVVSYYGKAGRDLSGASFRHGERVSEGERGVWERPLGPGKYAFNTYAGSIVLVPTTNFVLHWITGKSETHRYDESLRSIDLVTRDAYEPRLPLSVVVHIDYQRAPNVIQRFGDVKKLITQTLDPMLSAYFRDIAHKKTMLELLHDRDTIQREAREELRKKFHEFDMECVDVLIGKPDAEAGDTKISTLLEQLRTRQLSIEQLETYDRQRDAADRLRMLNEAQAQASMQSQLTNARVQIEIVENQAAAELARSRKQAEQVAVEAEGQLNRSRRQAEQTIVVADAELQRSRREADQTVLLAEARSRSTTLTGRGEAQRVMQVGLAEAAVLLKKVASYGDPRLFAIAGVSEQLSHATQPLVPERVFLAGGTGPDAGANGLGSGLVGMLLNLLIAEKSGFQLADGPEQQQLRELAERLQADALAHLQQPVTPTEPADAAPGPQARNS
ncbi:MAG: SPFH domain-containing protein [Planctomycetaceae bacterium]